MTSKLKHKDLPKISSVWFPCACNEGEHSLRFIVQPDLEDNYLDVWAEIHLCPDARFFKRIWYALRYIFSSRPARTGCGHFDTWLMNDPKVINDFKKFVAEIPIGYEETK